MSVKTGKATTAAKATGAGNLSYRELKAMVPATPKGKMPRADKIKGEILFSEDVDGAIITVYKDGFLTYTVNTANTDNTSNNSKNSNNCVSNASNNVKKSRKSGNNISNGKGIKGSRGQKNSNGQENCGNKKNTVTVYDEPRTTVYSVHKCSQIVFMTGFSTDEYKEECGWCGEHSKVTYRVVENPVTRNRQLTRIVTVDTVSHLYHLEGHWSANLAMALGSQSSMDHIITNDCGGFVEHHLGYHYGFVGLFGGT